MTSRKFYHNEVIVLAILCLANGIFLLYALSNLSISYYEARIFYDEKNLVSVIVNLSCQIFGQNDYALRVPFILIHFANVVLLYRISKTMLKRKFDRVICVMLYMCLPGVMASAILVSPAGIVIFFTLLMVYFNENGQKPAFYITLVVSILVDKSFAVLYLSMLFYAIFYRRKPLAILSIVLFVLTIIFYDFDVEGKPKGFFLDTIGVFAAVFSPFLFLFFIYTIYRIWVKERKTLLWFMAVSSFCLSALLSLRQRLELEVFLPYCVISAPLIIRMFFNSYRVRLPQFRKIHKFAATFAVGFLLLNSMVIIFNQALYPIFFKEKPQRHFVYKYDIAKELAANLEAKNILNINVPDDKLAIRLKFYGIGYGGQHTLYDYRPGIYMDEIKIKKYDINIAQFYIVKKENL